MEASAQIRRTRCGAFEVDLRSAEVYQRGIRLKLQDEPFQVLAFAEHPGEMVTHEELHHKRWPADSFVGFDTGLNRAIKKLADVLDSAEEPRYVETLPRQGSLGALRTSLVRTSTLRKQASSLPDTPPTGSSCIWRAR